MSSKLTFAEQFSPCVTVRFSITNNNNVQIYINIKKYNIEANIHEKTSSRAPSISQCACAVNRRKFGDFHFLGDPLRADDEVFVQHVFGVCVKHASGGVHVMVPVIPVGRGSHPVGGNGERWSLRNNPWRKKIC